MFVRSHLATIVSMSSGRMERKLITSAEIPSASSSLAASRQSATGRECATRVTDVPSRST